MTTIQDSDFLMGQGGKSWSPESIGDSIEGVVVSAVKRQQTEPGTGKVKTFDNGDPMYVYAITLQTEQRDPSDPNDEGLRTVYAKGGNASTDKGTTSLVAIRNAVTAAGAKGLEEGGVLKVAFTDTKKSNFPQPSKLFKARYTRPPERPFEDDLI